jgi:hypothetical protein
MAISGFFAAWMLGFSPFVSQRVQAYFLQT